MVRWEINPVTGAQDTPYEVSVNAQIALRELQKPVNKRSYSWARIRPIGETHVGIKHKADQNSLSDPELLSKLKEELKAQLRAELEAEMASAATLTEEEDKPKRKRKVVIEEELNSLDSPELRVDDLPL